MGHSTNRETPTPLPRCSRVEPQGLTEYALDSGEPAVVKQLFAFPADRCRKIAGLEGLEVPVEGGGRLSDRRSHDAELGAQTGFVLSCCVRASRAARSKKLRSL